ncbi:MAG: pyridoxal phosphate-dependent aminotransferase [Bacilli bacterium]
MVEKLIRNCKKIVKKVLKINNDIIYGDFKEENFSLALKELVEVNPEIVAIKKSVGAREDKKEFYPAVKKIEDAFKFYQIKVYEYEDENVPKILEYDGFHSGTPMKTKPFKPCIKGIKKALKSKTLFWYPNTVGGNSTRLQFLKYLEKEGFNLNPPKGYDKIGVDNIIFTCSTTHAFSMIVNLIARAEDVILLTGPNYGLFAIEPERMNARVEILNLKESDDWYVNPKDLSERIDEINKELKEKFANKLNYQPKVVAFLNMNPHNPLGKVMSVKNKDLIEKIGDICLEKGVFVIDDLIYRDLTFDQDNLALPMASYPKYFNNTISLFGLSKSYGLASFRAGVVVAPIPICHGISSQIFQVMDSIPTLQCYSLAGAFNGTPKRYKDAKKYFTPIIKEYKYRFLLFKALVEGINSISDEIVKQKIIKDIYHFEKDKNIRNILLEGIPNVYIKNKTTPESGFFAIIDFTKLKNKKYKDDIITGEFALLKYLFSKGKIQYIMGMSMSWPNDDEIVARINFGIRKKALINNCKIINQCVRKLD